MKTSSNTGLRGDDVDRLASLFYADDSAVGSLDLEWLQNANQHLCNLFRDYIGLKPNNDKIETMSCHPGAIRDQCTMDVYKRRHKGTGTFYREREGKRTVCTQQVYGKNLALGSL